VRSSDSPGSQQEFEYGPAAQAAVYVLRMLDLASTPRFQERCPVEGILHIENKLTGEVLLHQQNTILYDGREMLNYSLAGERAIDPIRFIAVGTGGYYPNTLNPSVDPPAPNEAAHALHAEVLRKQVFLPAQHTTRFSSVYNIEIDEGEAIDLKLTEFALITLGGLVFALRTTRPITKISQMILSITWTILT
jgi:hypothetical protein